MNVSTPDFHVSVHRRPLNLRMIEANHLRSISHPCDPI
jgi:hypothetical protein